jgi:hypothetical protein
MSSKELLGLGGGALVFGLALGLTFCKSETPTPAPTVAPAPAPAAAPAAAEPAGPLATILMSQAQFVTKDGKPAPGPAKLVLWRTDGKNWWSEVIEDPDSNVFHKAIWWRDGILTIAAGQLGFDPPKPATLKHWKRGPDGKWTATTIYEASWAGKFQRFRDVEVGDVNGDGKDEIVLATHDQGVVAVGTETSPDKWDFVQMDQTPDTFIHEVEIGDVDGDGKKEFYVTPSERNKASGESQPGGLARYDYIDGKYVRSWVAQWKESHAKEILVADVNGDGRDELYAVREGQTEKGPDGQLVVKMPVQILRYDIGKDKKWTELKAAEIPDKQNRFLVRGDVNGDGKTDLVAASENKGLFLLEQNGDGTFKVTQIDADSGGFENAVQVADLDGDGKLEIYNAADKMHEFRRYTWVDGKFEREKIADIPPQHITWNLETAKF